MASRQTKTPSQDHLTAVLVHDSGHLATKDRRHERAECGAEAQRDRIAQGDPEIADRQPEGEPSNAPHRSPKERMPHMVMRDGA